MTKEELSKMLEEHKKWRESCGNEGTRANLVNADLAGAELGGADLTRANLAGADLTRAYLAGAKLAGAKLARAYLVNADLAGAELGGADLTRAYLAGADLTRAKLAGAKLAGADLVNADLAAKPEYVVPVVHDLERRLLTEIQLDMERWHGDEHCTADSTPCGTTHCLAGGAIHLASEAGYALERQVGPLRAGRMIYRASCNGFAPHFFAPTDRALKQLMERVAEADAEAAK